MANAIYVSKSDILDLITEENEAGGFTDYSNYSNLWDEVDGIPAADVQPVKRGRWDFQGYQLFKCTNCNEMFTQNQLEAMQNHKDCEECAFPNYCPNCGANMRGEYYG